MTTPLHEAAKVTGGTLQIHHSHLCGTHRNAPCRCDPTYTLRRTPRRKGVRR